LSTEKPDISTLKKAAISSYVMGSWFFVAMIVMIVSAVIVILPLLPAMGYGYGYGYGAMPDISQIAQILDALLIPIVAVAGLTIPIAIMFGYFTYKAGNVYHTSSLQVAGASVMIVAVAVVPIVYGVYLVFEAVKYAVGLDTVAAVDYIMGSMGALALGAILAVIFGLVFLISFIVGLSNLKNSTGVSEFGVAMWLMIVGLITMIIGIGGILIPIGILLFGVGLGKSGRQGVERRVAPPGIEEGAKAPARRQIVYCPYCGAKVESDALFCPTCGSSLRKEA
jgi:hypothetical protein